MPDEISSLQNPRVKQASRLRDGRQRQSQGRYLIDGARELRRAIQAGVTLDEVYVCPPLCRSEDSRAVLNHLAECKARVFSVPAPVMDKLCFGGRNEGVVAVAPTVRRPLNKIDLPHIPLVAVLEGVEKPGNVGAVLRSADAAGVHALVVADGATDLYNPNAIRASLGTIFTVPIAAASSRETLEWLRARKLSIYVARVDASRLYTQVDYLGPSAVVLGSEAEGLSNVWSGPDVTPIRLPMCGLADSLNVSAAAAVVFYEALRQRGL